MNDELKQETCSSYDRFMTAKMTFLGIEVSYPGICSYPEYEGKPYYAIKYLEDGETYVGFGTYKPDVLSDYLRRYFIPSARGFKYCRCLPESKAVWIAVHDGETQILAPRDPD